MMELELEKYHESVDGERSRSYCLGQATELLLERDHGDTAANYVVDDGHAGKFYE